MKRIAGIILLTLVGCGQPVAHTTNAKETTAGPRFDVQAIREDIRKPFADPEQLRLALEQLNAAEHAKTTLDTETIKTLREKLRFTEADIATLNRAEFGPLDGHVLYQALFFLAISETLEVKAEPPVVRATAALEWVVRHIMLDDTSRPPDPPAWVARRGRGTGLERLYVFATLCHALGLEAFVIGDEGATTDVSKLWAVGVVDAAEIRVFDPRLGVPLPGPKYEVATWAGLQKDSATLQPLWAVNYDVTAERLKSARLFPAMSIPSLAPRWARVSFLAPPGTRVGFDAKLLAEQTARLSLYGFDAQSTGTPLRVLAEFLLPEQGGTDRPLKAANQLSRKTTYDIDMTPWQLLPRELREFPGLRQVFRQWSAADQIPGITELIRKQQSLQDAARMMMNQEKEAPTDPRLAGDMARNVGGGVRGLSGDETAPTLQQLILRGKYDEATNGLIVLVSQLRTIQQGSNTAALEPAVKEWAANLSTALAERERAMKAGNQAGVAKAEATLEKLAPDNKKALAYVLALAAESSQIRLAYLGALAKHDQTEAKARRDRNPSVWAAAVLAWNTFLANHPNAAESGSAHRLLADALEGEGKKTAAAAAYRKAAEVAKNPFDRMACLYLAKLNE